MTGTCKLSRLWLCPGILRVSVMSTLYLPAPTFIFLGKNKSNDHLTKFITFLTGMDHHKEIMTYLSGLMANFSLKVDVGWDLFCLPPHWKLAMGCMTHGWGSCILWRCDLTQSFLRCRERTMSGVSYRKQPSPFKICKSSLYLICGANIDSWLWANINAQQTHRTATLLCQCTGLSLSQVCFLWFQLFIVNCNEKIWNEIFQKKQGFFFPRW